MQFCAWFIMLRVWQGFCGGSFALMKRVCSEMRGSRGRQLVDRFFQMIHHNLKRMRSNTITALQDQAHSVRLVVGCKTILFSVGRWHGSFHSRTVTCGPG